MLEKLIAEATEYEIKGALEDRKPKSWLKSVSAFANGIGGTLIFGVADNHTIVGLEQPQRDAETISRLVKERITPLPGFILTPFIHIDMFDDRLEIWSPGGMFEGRPVQERDIEHIVSTRRNPVIADLFHRMKYMERRGSGLKKIVDESKKLPGYTEELKPEFISTPSDFRVVLKNINYHLRGKQQVTPQVTPQVDMREKILAYCDVPRSKREIAEHCGLKDLKHLNDRYLKPLLIGAELEMTVPKKPKSRNQKYVRVAK